MRIPALSIALPLLALSLSQPASAHAHLLHPLPAADATVKASPTELRLKFSEGLEVKFSGVMLTGPDKARIGIGAPSLDPADPTLMIVPLPTPLTPGHYEVDWHATAVDTHKTQGHYGFTVAP